jgi:hypothetical protein
MLEIRNALVIPGKHNGLAFFWEHAGVIPKPHPRH